MDLGSRLANLSLAEIASLLNTKQQEVLLASISVAAGFIQQLQAEEQAQAQEAQAQPPEGAHLHHHASNLLNFSTNNNNSSATSHHSNTVSHSNSIINNNANAHSIINSNNNNNNNITTTTTTCESPNDDDFEDDINDQSSDFSFEDCPDISHSASTADRQTLSTIREFAEELKHRRKSIRLSQKGAAQSLRAFTSGEQPCTDAIIYHFENLQLEPERALQLIPLLRDWLDWAEKHRLNGKQLPMMGAVAKVPRERKRKVVLFNEKAKQYLEDAFLKNNHPDRYQLDVISQELNIPTRSIRKWFTNRRQRKRFAEKFSPVS